MVLPNIGRAVSTYGNLQGLIGQAQDRKLAEQQREQQQAAQGSLNALKQQYAQTKDPETLRQIILNDPESAAKIQQQFGAIDDLSRTDKLNKAAALKQMIERNPQEAATFFQSELANDPAFDRLTDNFQTGDMTGALDDISFTVTALGGQEAYDNLFGGVQGNTDFIRDLMAGGIDPKSEEGKAIILEKYGKGQTIGYDVIESLNPETGRNEFYQVSRVNPGEKIPLGLEVPMTASEIEADKAAAESLESEKNTLQNTLSTVQKILKSPGLSGFSGLDSFKKLIPGTEAANVNAWVEQLQSQNFLTAVEQMKGMGALSENEGKKLAGSVAAIDSSMSDDALLSELQGIEADLLKGLERIESNTLLDVGATQTQGNTVNWSDLE